MKKVLNITNHQEIANQNHNERSPHTCQNGYHQKDKILLTGYGEKGRLVHCWWECKLVQPLWKTAWRFLKKLKIELPYDPASPLLGIHLKKTKALIQKDAYTPMFIAALFTIGKIWKQPKCPSTDEWVKKMWYTHTHTHTHTYIHTYI